MNNRFRFRVWDKEEESFCPDLWDVADTTDFLYELSKEGNFVLQQCTGLKDRAGDLIYEGDYLSFMTDPPSKFKLEVTWSEDEAGFGLAQDNIEGTCNLTKQIGMCSTVTGNIFEGKNEN